jgi:hypothetical protein
MRFLGKEFFLNTAKRIGFLRFPIIRDQEAGGSNPLTPTTSQNFQYYDYMILNEAGGSSAEQWPSSHPDKCRITLAFI